MGVGPQRRRAALWAHAGQTSFVERGSAAASHSREFQPRESNIIAHLSLSLDIAFFLLYTERKLVRNTFNPLLRGVFFRNEDF